MQDKSTSASGVTCTSAIDCPEDDKKVRPGRPWTGTQDLQSNKQTGTYRRLLRVLLGSRRVRKAAKKGDKRKRLSEDVHVIFKDTCFLQAHKHVFKDIIEEEDDDGNGSN